MRRQGRGYSFFSNQGAGYTPQYSSVHRQFNAVLSQGTQASSYQSVQGHLAKTRLAQTNALDVIRKNPRDTGTLLGPYIKDVGPIVSGSYKAVGIIRDEYGFLVGSCFLIAHNLALISCHSIEGQDVTKLTVHFEYNREPYNFNSGFRYPIVKIGENDPYLDYAVVELSGTPGLTHGFIPLSNARLTDSHEVMLLHYPHGKSLQVSIHAVNQNVNFGDRREVYHDSDLGSSGGPYIAPNGKCVGVHLGIEAEQNEQHFTFNLSRYALEMRAIIERSPAGFIAKIVNGEIAQNRSFSISNPLYYLAIRDRPYLDIEMNRQRYLKKAKVEEERSKKLKTAAAGRTRKRLEKHDREEYEIMNVRDLASTHPELGAIILKNKEFTDTNKILFKNIHTGWYVCYDIEGKYNTVINSIGHYVALDGSTSADGKGEEFHFRNTSEPLSPSPRPS